MNLLLAEMESLLGRVEHRDPPTAQDITKAIKKAKKLPDDGDADHILPPFDFYEKPLPVISGSDWAKARQKQVKIGKLQASTARIVRSNLVWHLQNPGKSRFQGQFNTHLQVLKTKNDDLVIIDGHHRASALKMLGVKKETTWCLDEKDL